MKGGGEGNFSLSFNLFPFLCNFTISLTSLYIQILVRRTGGVRLGIFTYDLRGGEGCLLIYYILKDIKREAFVDYNIWGRGFGLQENQYNFQLWRPDIFLQMEFLL